MAMTWADLLTQIVAAYDAVGTSHPELTTAEVVPGAQVTFTVSAGDIGAVAVVVNVPTPLTPPPDVVTVSFRDVTWTEVTLPVPEP